MVAENANPERGVDQTKKLILELRKKVPVETTVGTLFARRYTVKDLEPFGVYLESKEGKAATDLRALGQLSLRTLVNERSEPEQTGPLAEAVYGRLGEDDIKALASGVAQASRLNLPRDEDAFKALGAAIFDHVIEHGKRLAESGAQMRELIGQQFAGISDSVRRSLETSLGGLSSLRATLRRSEGFDAFRKMADDEKALRKQLTDSLGSTGFEALRKMTEDDKALRMTLNDSVRSDSVLAELRRSVQEQEGLKAAVPEDFVARVERVARLDVPRVAETPIGRAAQASEESARQLKEVAGVTAQLADKVAEVIQVVMTEVLPEWYRSVCVRRSRLENGLRSDNDAVQLTNSWTRWKPKTVASAGATAAS